MTGAWPMVFGEFVRGSQACCLPNTSQRLPGDFRAAASEQKRVALLHGRSRLPFRPLRRLLNAVEPGTDVAFPANSNAVSYGPGLRLNEIKKPLANGRRAAFLRIDAAIKDCLPPHMIRSMVSVEPPSTPGRPRRHESRREPFEWRGRAVWRAGGAVSDPPRTSKPQSRCPIGPTIRSRPESQHDRS